MPTKKNMVLPAPIKGWWKSTMSISKSRVKSSNALQWSPEKLSRLRTWPGSNSARHTSLGCLWWDRQWQLDVGMDEKCLEDLALSLWCWFMCFVCFILGEILETGLPQHCCNCDVCLSAHTMCNYAISSFKQLLLLLMPNFQSICCWVCLKRVRTCY